MSKIVVPDIQGRELFEFLIANKAGLVAQKKAFIKECDPIGCGTEIYSILKHSANKNDMGIIPMDTTSLNVKVVANTSMWMDSQSDVLLRDSASKSIKERKPMIKMLKDHGRTLDSEIADVNDIYYQDIPLTELGLQKTGTAQALIFDADVQKSYDEKTFNKYKQGKVNQHSIGLQYIRLELAINDSDYEKEQDFWNKYIDQVINKEEAQSQGYFWVVPEYKLIENSAVLFGANSLTPTLSTGAKNTQLQPPVSTVEEPLEYASEIKSHLKTVKFF